MPLVFNAIDWVIGVAAIMVWPIVGVAIYFIWRSGKRHDERERLEREQAAASGAPPTQ